MKQYLGRIGIVIALLVVPVLIAPQTSAHELSEKEQKALDVERKAAEQRQKVVDAEHQKKAQIKQRLDSLSLKICEKRQGAIKKSMTNVVDARQKQIDHIAEISSRVQAFYTKQGHVLANYDTLVAAVADKKAAAQAALDATKSDAPFSCDSDGPKAQLQAFRNKRTTMIDAIKAYRQAVKDLIRGVKSVQPDKEATS